jgi:hypothetical protein
LDAFCAQKKWPVALDRPDLNYPRGQPCEAGRFN